MCYSEPFYEERKKQLHSTTNVSISEEISSGLLIRWPDDISSEIETFVVEFSCFFLSSYLYIIYIKAVTKDRVKHLYFSQKQLPR